MAVVVNSFIVALDLETQRLLELGCTEWGLRVVQVDGRFFDAPEAGNSCWDFKFYELSLGNVVSLNEGVGFVTDYMRHPFVPVVEATVFQGRTVPIHVGLPDCPPLWAPILHIIGDADVFQSACNGGFSIKCEWWGGEGRRLEDSSWDQVPAVDGDSSRRGDDLVKYLCRERGAFSWIKGNIVSSSELVILGVDARDRFAARAAGVAAAPHPGPALPEYFSFPGWFQPDQGLWPGRGMMPSDNPMWCQMTQDLLHVTEGGFLSGQQQQQQPPPPSAPGQFAISGIPPVGAIGGELGPGVTPEENLLLSLQLSVSSGLDMSWARKVTNAARQEFVRSCAEGSSRRTESNFSDGGSPFLSLSSFTPLSPPFKMPRIVDETEENGRPEEYVPAVQLEDTREVKEESERERSEWGSADVSAAAISLMAEPKETVGQRGVPEQMPAPAFSNGGAEEMARKEVDAVVVAGAAAAGSGGAGKRPLEACRQQQRQLTRGGALPTRELGPDDWLPEDMFSERYVPLAVVRQGRELNKQADCVRLMTNSGLLMSGADSPSSTPGKVAARIALIGDGPDAQDLLDEVSKLPGFEFFLAYGDKQYEGISAVDELDYVHKWMRRSCDFSDPSRGVKEVAGEIGLLAMTCALCDWSGPFASSRYSDGGSECFERATLVAKEREATHVNLSLLNRLASRDPCLTVIGASVRDLPTELEKGEYWFFWSEYGDPMSSEVHVFNMPIPRSDFQGRVEEVNEDEGEEGGVDGKGGPRSGGGTDCCAKKKVLRLDVSGLGLGNAEGCPGGVFEVPLKSKFESIVKLGRSRWARVMKMKPMVLYAKDVLRNQTVAMPRTVMSYVSCCRIRLGLDGSTSNGMGIDTIELQVTTTSLDSFEMPRYGRNGATEPFGFRSTNAGRYAHAPESYRALIEPRVAEVFDRILPMVTYGNRDMSAAERAGLGKFRAHPLMCRVQDVERAVARALGMGEGDVRNPVRTLRHPVNATNCACLADGMIAQGMLQLCWVLKSGSRPAELYQVGRWSLRISMMGDRQEQLHAVLGLLEEARWECKNGSSDLSSRRRRRRRRRRPRTRPSGQALTRLSDKDETCSSSDDEIICQHLKAIDSTGLGVQSDGTGWLEYRDLLCKAVEALSQKQKGSARVCCR
ncbi:hypothetical protein CBR_g28740 [Chara braunii]|uniref:Uncharacterized protein n=1 Tax=Chara braunii TaxID=69332 RepID=A0A388L9N4_CHABU|nr:hypothetical protein CBR_g28740 [Chara braunii]|eukprot:GBG79027.1 hypothetical protein CBR_g28740 [Chara braunii]